MTSEPLVHILPADTGGVSSNSDIEMRQNHSISSDRPNDDCSSSAVAEFVSRIEHRTAVVAIIGLGYVGLPLARLFSTRGFRVIGFDIDGSKVESLNSKRSYLKHIPGDDIERMLVNGFVATNDFRRLGEADAVLICVPTPLTESREPDLTFVVNSARAVASTLRPNQLVVLESTTYPGTTRDILLPLLQGRGFTLGEDMFLAFSPEREDPGNPTFSTSQIPKVVGGFEEHSQIIATTLYAAVVSRVVPVASPEIAEACKILENSYRAVNIALVNELKVLFDRMGIDIWEVIEAAKTKPFGFEAFYPSPGLGGHCIPIDPFYLTWIARKHGLSTRFIELAGEINSSMPSYVIGQIADALNDRGKPVKGSNIAILGIAYKRDVDDARESPGLELIKLLAEKGAAVTYHDPYIPSIPATRKHPELRMDSEELTGRYLSSQDCVVIITDHTVFDGTWIVEHSKLVVDTRNLTRDAQVGREKIIKS